MVPDTHVHVPCTSSLYYMTGGRKPGEKNNTFTSHTAAFTYKNKKVSTSIYQYPSVCYSLIPNLGLVLDHTVVCAGLQDQAASPYHPD